MSSKFLQVADFCLETNTGVGRDLIKNGFLSGVERIVLSGDSKVEEIDQIRFARDHVKNNITALKVVDIQVHNNINVEALADLLAVSPKVWSINLKFYTTTSIQRLAHNYWKILLAILYCNANSKTISIYDEGVGNGPTCHERPEWSFIKKADFKQYRNLQAPGKVESFNFCGHMRRSYWEVFFTAPVWSQLSIESLTCPLVNQLDDEILDVNAKCANLIVDYTCVSLNNSLPIFPWIYFGNCDKLIIKIYYVNYYRHASKHHSILKLVKHENLHLVLENPIKVSDANPNPVDPGYWYNNWYARVYWTLDDVKHFVNSIVRSSVRTLTYTVSNDKSNKDTVTFYCDEQFVATFTEFLKTQPIYCGYNDESFLTLNSAKKSFPAQVN